MREIDGRLFEAVMERNIEGVLKAIADGADPNENNNDGWTPLRLAAFSGCLNVVQILLEKGADIHTDDDVALRDAAQWGYLDIVQYLVEKGADPNAKDENGETPLHLATSKNRFDIAKVLRDYAEPKENEAIDS